MQVSSQLYVSAVLIPENKVGTHWIGCLVGFKAGLNVLKENFYIAAGGIRTQYLSARNLVSIPTRYFVRTRMYTPTRWGTHTHLNLNLNN